MKIFIIILFFITIPSQTLYSQQGWISKNIGDGNFVSINFINTTTGFAFRSNKWLMKTTNSGENWNGTFLNMVPILIETGMFYNNDVGIFLGTYVFITTNGGVTWQQSVPPSMSSLWLKKVIMINETTGYACGTDYDLDLPVDGIISRTTNAGINWVSSYPGGFDYFDVKFINETTGYSCWGELVKTNNGGVNWNYVSSPFRSMNEISQIFNDTFYVACDEGYVVKTTNSGNSWISQYTGVNVNFNDVFFTNNRIGYVVGDSGYVFRTTDGGNYWTQQSTNTFRDLNEVWFINNDTGFIAGDSGTFLVTYNGGVTSLSQNNQSIPEHFILHQNHPNPFNPSTKIQFAIPKSTFVQLTVYDILGREAAKLVNENLSAGSYEYEFDGSGLNSGVYFY